MNIYKYKGKVLAAVLSVAMMAGGMPVSALAEMNEAQTQGSGNVTITGDISSGIYAGNGLGENGNISEGLGDPSGNTLTFNSGSGTVSNASFIGGYSNNGSDASNNTVTVNGGNFQNSFVCGGFSEGNSIGNLIIINNFQGTISDVLGGGSNNGDVSNNQIVINSGELTGEITSGDSSGNVTNNTITLSGDVRLGERVSISAGDAYQDSFTGNTLNWGLVGSSISKIENFQYINFTLPVSLDENDTIVTTRLNCYLKNQDDQSSTTYSTIGILVDSGSSLQIGDKVTLIHVADGSVLDASGINTTAVDDNSGYEFALSVNGNDLIATVTSITYPVTGINLSSTSADLKVGETLALSATVVPNNAADQSVIWGTSNSSIAGVDQSGNVTAMGVGTATVTATSHSNENIIASCTVNVLPIEVHALNISETSTSLIVGETKTLTTTASPKNATDTSVTWSSLDTNIATVDTSGVVTATGVGSTTITATSNSNASVSASCTIQVAAATVTATGISLNMTSNSLKAGNTVALSATITPANTTNTGVTWSSSDTNIAIVDENGLVTATGVGSTTITATSNSNPSLSAICTITGTIGKTANLTTTKNKTTSITLTWEKQNNVNGYQVYRYDSSKKKYVKIATIKKASTTSYTNKKLSVATAYQYKVRAYVKVNGKTKYGSYSSILKTATVSKKPVLTAKAGSKKVTLTWDKVSSVSVYEIYMSTKKNSGYSKIKTVSSKKTKYTKTKLTKGTTYYYKIRTYKKVNGVKIYSSYSTVKKVKVK